MDGYTGAQHFPTHPILYSDVTRFVGQAGFHHNLTLSNNHNYAYFLQESDVWRDARVRQFTPWWELSRFRRRLLRPATDYNFWIQAQNVADVVAAGGSAATGSESGLQGLGEHWEVWMLADAVGPLESLKLATLHGARFLGIDAEVGSLEVGKIADLLVLRANPLEGIRNTATIEYVMKDGVLYHSATLDQVWPESRPFGEYPWRNRDMLRTDSRE